jgi:hypothetical protein
MFLSDEDHGQSEKSCALKKSSSMGILDRKFQATTLYSHGSSKLINECSYHDSVMVIVAEPGR